MMDYQVPYIVGESRLVYEPEPLKEVAPWFINDHCFVADAQGLLHLFCINDPYPPEGKGLYSYHPFLGHATTPSPLAGWQRESFVFDERERSEYVGAPYVVRLDGAQKYVMVFETKHTGRRGLELAWSDDLYQWDRTNQRVPANLSDDARDPCILKAEDGSFRIYLCTPDPGGSAIVLLRTTDFQSFQEPVLCLQIADGITYGGMESPFVVERGGLFYLFFTYAHRHYYETVVTVSDRCDAFTMDNVITTLYGHASEIVTYEGETYISSCGPEDMQRLNRHGLYLAKLAWFRP